MTYAQNHMNLIAAKAETPEGLAEILWFAVATAQCPFQASVNTISQLRKWGSDIEFVVYSEITVEQKSKMGVGINGNKLAAFQYIWVNRDVIHDKFKECKAEELGHITFWNYLIDCVPGLGMTKAAFSVQMSFAGGLLCLDVHNMRKLGYDGCLTGKSKVKRAKYLELSGNWTSEQAWGGWCESLAEKYSHLFESGEHVSALHVYGLTGKMPEYN